LAEFQQFVSANGILHRQVQPYHPASNGLTKNMVRTVKDALKKAKITRDATLDTLIARFLASYRNTRHSTTSKAPAELLLNWTPQTHLSLVHPCTVSTSQRLELTAKLRVGDHQPRCFADKDDVMIRDLRSNARDKWCGGIVTKVLGPLTYEVLVDERTRQAHIDHLLLCAISVDVDDSNPSGEQLQP